MKSKFKLKITDFDNKPIVKAQAENIDEFDSIFQQLKKKYRGRNGR